MKLSEFTEWYSLHDSSFCACAYMPEEGWLVIDIESCNDGEWPVSADSPDILPLRLVFTGVTAYTLDADALDFENDEINHVRLSPSTKPEKEVVELVILNTSDIGCKIMRIEAEDVSWHMLQDEKYIDELRF